MSRLIGSIVGGLVAGVLLTLLIEWIGNWWFPPVVVTGRSFQEQVRLGATQPQPGSYLIAAFGWMFGAFGGALLAGLVAERAHREHAWIVGGLLVISSFWNLLGGGYPWWFWILAVLGVPAAAWMAGSASQRARE